MSGKVTLSNYLNDPGNGMGGSKIVFSASASNILLENRICGIWMIQQSQNQIK